jgi:hypothetical protein
LIEWGRRPEAPVANILYVIWKDPWMSVSKSTFIGSVLEKCGMGSYLPDFKEKYPKIELTAYSPSQTVLLFASEPYPFLRKRQDLLPIQHPHAFVEGECFSWFGVRALRFLESLQARGQTPA